MEVSTTNYRKNFMVVYETQLKCGLHIPLSFFILQLFEGWGIFPRQLAPNAFTVMNIFMVACHLVDCDPNFVTFLRPRDQYLFSLPQFYT